MLNNKIQGAFNKQLNAEMFSSYFYLSMAAYFESQNLKGMAHWMRLQADEEMGHAMKFFDYINERGGRVSLTSLDAPKTEWGSPLEVFEDTCTHEAKVTGLVHDLVELAMAQKDHAAAIFLQWFVTEQVEEEATAKEIRDRLLMLKDNPVALIMIDRQLGTRSAPGGAPS